MRKILAGVFGSALCVFAQIPDFTPPTALFAAALRNDATEVMRLLDAGADPNQGQFMGAPPIFAALGLHSAEIVEAMIAKGANVKATDAGGSTTLMWAAYSETADTRPVETLLRLGVDPNAKNKQGETALSWAMRRGSAPVIELLKRAGASDREMVQASVEKSIGLLQKSGPEFVRVSGCTSCHNQSLPQMAYSLARQRGLKVDEKVAREQVISVLLMFKPFAEDMAQAKPNLPDPAITVSYALAGLAAEGYAPDATTAAMAHLVSAQQMPDGSFLALPMRPPIESSTFTATAMSLRALQVYGKDAGPRITRAREWLQTAKPYSNEDRAMQLLGLSWAGAGEEYRRMAATGLLKEQQPDGGWAQLPGLETDAYATGQALMALVSSGQAAPSSAAYQRGVEYLLRTQRDDGSWFVRSRTNPFQPYKESGFPHGRHQWISAAGTSWAAMALSMTQPVRELQMSKMMAPKQ